MPINPIHAALLSNGKVLVVAGSGNCPPSQSGCPSGPPYGPSNSSGALLLDPVSGQTISQFSQSWDMFCNGMVLLDDGRPFIASGTIQYDPFYGQPQTATFDPQANTFSNGPNMAHGRWYPTLVTLGDGRVMIFSGLNETGSTNTAVEFYSVDTAGVRNSPPRGPPISIHACTSYRTERCSIQVRKPLRNSSILRRIPGTRTSQRQITVALAPTARLFCCN